MGKFSSWQTDDSFLFFPENKLCTFSKEPSFWEKQDKYFKTLSAEFFT